MQRRIPPERAFSCAAPTLAPILAALSVTRRPPVRIPAKSNAVSGRRPNGIPGDKIRRHHGVLRGLSPKTGLGARAGRLGKTRLRTQFPDTAGSGQKRPLQTDQSFPIRRLNVPLPSVRVADDSLGMPGSLVDTGRPRPKRYRLASNRTLPYLLPSLMGRRRLISISAV